MDISSELTEKNISNNVDATHDATKKLMPSIPNPNNITLKNTVNKPNGILSILTMKDDISLNISKDIPDSVVRSSNKEHSFPAVNGIDRNEDLSEDEVKSQKVNSLINKITEDSPSSNKLLDTGNSANDSSSLNNRKNVDSLQEKDSLATDATSNSSNGDSSKRGSINSKKSSQSRSSHKSVAKSIKTASQVGNSAIKKDDRILTFDNILKNNSETESRLLKNAKTLATNEELKEEENLLKGKSTSKDSFDELDEFGDLDTDNIGAMDIENFELDDSVDSQNFDMLLKKKLEENPSLNAKHIGINQKDNLKGECDGTLEKENVNYINSKELSSEGISHSPKPFEKQKAEDSPVIGLPVKESDCGNDKVGTDKSACCDKDDEEDEAGSMKSVSTSQPVKKKLTNSSKDKFFLEALSSLESEDHILSLIKVQPLKPSAEIPSLPPTKSLTLLETVSQTEGSQHAITTKGSTYLTNNSSLALQFTSGDTLQVSSKSNESSTFDHADNDNRPSAVKRGIEDVADSQSSDLKKVRVFKKRGRPRKKVSAESSENIKDTLEASKMMERTLAEVKSKSIDEENSTLSRTCPTEINEEEVERLVLKEKTRLQNVDTRKLQRIKRKDLENLVIQLFMDKILYEHELGSQRDLCKRLEATMETSRKKSAQFHKEVDDLKKVTQRLQSEHMSRKNQIVAPVRVKRSVGIQATPTIINKGLIQAPGSNTVRILSPSKTPRSTRNDASSIRSQVSQSSPSSNTFTKLSQITQTSSLSTQASRSNICITSVAAHKAGVGLTKYTGAQTITSTAGTAPAQVLMVNPSQIVVQQPTNAVNPSTLMPMARVVRAPMAQIGSLTNQQPILLQQQTSVAASTVQKSNSAVIDLTDDEEISKARMKSNTSVVTLQRPVSNTAGQFVTLPLKTGPQQSSPVSQLLLLPSTTGQTGATLVVSSMANSIQTSGSPAALRTTAAGLLRASNPPQVTAASQAMVVPVGGSRFVAGTQNITSRVVNGGSIQSQPNKHPAPLPRATPQQTVGFSKMLPPKPVLKLSHKESSIILTWNMTKSADDEVIASYQLYAYQETSAPPSFLLWKKVGSVKALELPMACTLTQFMPGHMYHFAVRAVDIRNRLGSFSEPKSIRLGK